MKYLIDKEALNSRLAFFAALPDIWEVIWHMPTVESVPVVRCGECKYWDRFPSCSATPQYHACKRRIFADVHTTRDEFCSSGERKDDEANENH